MLAEFSEEGTKRPAKRGLDGACHRTNGITDPSEERLDLGSVLDNPLKRPPNRLFNRFSQWLQRFFSANLERLKFTQHLVEFPLWGVETHINRLLNRPL